MTQAIQFRGGYSRLTKSSGSSAEAGTPRSAPAVIYKFEQHLYRTVSSPDRYSDIQDVVAASEKNPKRRAALKRARAKLADQLKCGQGETIRSARLRNGWSQTYLAQELGTSQPHIARIERGSENVSWETMQKLCSALQVDMNTLNEMLQCQRLNFESEQS